MKISFNIRSTRNKRKKDIIHRVYNTEHSKQRIVHDAHFDELTEQKNVHYVHNIKHTEHNALDTIFLYLYNDERFLK